MNFEMFDDRWKSLLRKATENPTKFSDYYSTHQIKKLSLTQFKIEEIQEKIKELKIKYKSDHTLSSKIWMENQYRLFLWATLTYAQIINRQPIDFNFHDWNFLSQMFNKPPILCNYFYLCSRKGRNSPWTQEEDHFLCEVMKLPDYHSRWTDIGILLFVQTGTNKFRKPKAIRERWLNHLNPEIVKQKWKVEEDITIFNMVLQEGKKWSKISKVLKNRSQHSIKNRFNGLLSGELKNESQKGEKCSQESSIRNYLRKLKTSIEKDKIKEQETDKTIKKLEVNIEFEEKVDSFNNESQFLKINSFEPTLIIQPQFSI